MLVPAINSVIKMIMALDAVASLRAPSASCDRADKRAIHLLPNALHRSCADAALTRHLPYAFAATQMRLDALFKRGIDPRPTELRALCDRAFKASVDALPDHAALKLGKRTADLKHELAGRRRGVDRLLVEVEIDAAGLQRLDRAQQVDQASSDAINTPRHDDVELAPGRILEHLVEAWTPIAALCAANACITVLLDDVPAPPFGDLAQGGDLVLDGLLVGRYADVNSGALMHDSPQCCQQPITSAVLKTAVCWTSTRAEKHH